MTGRQEGWRDALKTVGEKVEQLVKDGKLKGEGVAVIAEMCGITTIASKTKYAVDRGGKNG